MINAIMHHLVYDAPPSYNKYNEYREYLRKISNYSCAYCTITESENPGATFNIDHFRPASLFQGLRDECSNLRYSCPRCNSYKRQRWISKAQGCVRDCNNCTSKACLKNIERFIDVLSEDPSKLIQLGEDDKIYALFGSKPAEYTIKYLRLNRNQLVKLRHVRRFMDNWQRDLIEKKKEAEERLVAIKSEWESFDSKKRIPSSNQEKIYMEMINTMYQMLITHVEQWRDQLEEEEERLAMLVNYKTGNDEVINH